MPVTINLDNNATTPILPDVVDAMLSAMSPTIGNPSSSHRYGVAARRVIDRARTEVATLLTVLPDQIVFTSGATEANDAVLRSHNTRLLLSTPGAHPSLNGGHDGERKELPTDRSGLIELGRLRELLRHRRDSIVAVSMVCGETGIIQPVKEICEIAASMEVPTLIDLSQAAGRVHADELQFCASYLSVSAHKLNGPKGIGCLIIGADAEAPRMAAGGGQESGRRSGTENIAGIAGFGAACRLRQASLESSLSHMRKIRDSFEKQILNDLPFVRLNGQDLPRAATTSSVTFSGVDGMALVARLDAEGVLCSQVSACTSGRPEPSATLMSMGLSENDAFSTIRFSVTPQTTTDELRRATEIIKREASFLHSIMAEAT